MSIAAPITLVQPLSPEHLGAITTARRQAKSIRRATRVAAFNGWAAAVFGGLSVLMSLGSLAPLLLGLGLLGAGCNELRCGRRLARLDAGAPRGLALNQLFLAGVVWAYCGWNLYRAIAGPGLFGEASSDPQVAEMLAPYERLAGTIMAAVYGGGALIVAIVQAVMAWYYLSRRRHIAVYLKSTPPWVADLQRRGDLA